MKNNFNLLSIAVVQMCSTDNYESNFLKIEKAILQAAQKNVDVIAFPENALYLKAEGEKISWSIELEKQLIGKLKTLAIESRVFLLIGSVPESIRGSRKIYNSSLVISPEGNIVSRYRKIHLFDVTLPDGTELYESVNVNSGKQVQNCLINNWNFGLSICYDVRFPELYRRIRKKGAEIIAVPSAFTVPTGKVHWEILLRARAIENQCYVIAPAQTGKHSDTRESYGHSMIIDPWGSVIASAKTQETILFATLDKNEIQKVRERMPCWENKRLKV